MKRKRSNGEGSIWKDGRGHWRGQIMDGYTDEGKKNVISFSAPTRAEVQDLIREYLNNKDAHVHVNKKMDLSSWADRWYENYETQVQASTYDGYRYTLKIIKKRLGGLILCDVLPLSIDRFLDSLVADGYGLSQIRKCRTMLIQIFDAAGRNGLVASNPARNAKIIRDKDGTLSQPRYLKDAFNDEEITLLWKELKHDLMGHSIRLMLRTGLRVQELIALAPSDIAEDGSSIYVHGAMKIVNNKPVLGCTKSKSSVRMIPVPEDAKSSAQYLREHGGSALVWSLPGRNPYYSVSAFRRRYYNAIAEIDGVRQLSPHCCRHTYVTQLQKKGVALELIAQLAGHASIETTNLYAHPSMETLKAAVAMLGAS